MPGSPLLPPKLSPLSLLLALLPWRNPSTAQVNLPKHCCIQLYLRVSLCACWSNDNNKISHTMKMAELELFLHWKHLCEVASPAVWSTKDKSNEKGAFHFLCFYPWWDYVSFYSI
jgi:hypothetical protein